MCPRQMTPSLHHIPFLIYRPYLNFINFSNSLYNNFLLYRPLLRITIALLCLSLILELFSTFRFLILMFWRVQASYFVECLSIWIYFLFPHVWFMLWCVCYGRSITEVMWLFQCIRKDMILLCSTINDIRSG